MSDFDYDLPAELIAQGPLEDRSGSRLLNLNRQTGEITHRTFRDLPEMLQPGDLLVLNDSRVLPARLVGHRFTGGQAEALLLREVRSHLWECLIKPARKLRIGEVLEFPGRSLTEVSPATATVIEKRPDGLALVELDDRLAKHPDCFGRIPLPPYIHRALDDDERYQTVYATDSGSAAAPTAGLHFTTEMLTTLRRRDVACAFITLHVGLDTFRPVATRYAQDHSIHSEWCRVSEATAEAIASARKRGSRIIAVGTTSARTLETYGSISGLSSGAPYSGMTRLYITPGHEWRMVDAMITNFHLPRSSLLLMMSSFTGKATLFEAYRQAIELRYRFLSFGDAMFVE